MMCSVFLLRNPIPDYYSITLEIARDRTTSAAVLTCDPNDETKPRCPENANEGDKFLHRTLNEACTKMVGSKETNKMP